MKISGVDEVKKRLADLVVKLGDPNVEGTVGYTAPYAIYVHENLGAVNGGMKLVGQPRPSGLGVYWGPAGGPKFLEGPAREMSAELARTVSDAVRGGKTVGQGILLACLKLQRESMKRVPVEYGWLRASAFTEVKDSTGVIGTGGDPNLTVPTPIEKEVQA